MRYLNVAFLIAFAFPHAVLGATFLINPAGTGDFTTIQGAVYMAADGDTVLLDDGVFRGYWNRDIDYLGKAIVVRALSDDPTTCILDCEGSYSDSASSLRLSIG